MQALSLARLPQLAAQCAGAITTTSTASSRPLLPPPCYGVSVTPDGLTTTRSANGTGFSETFWVENFGTQTDTYTISCSGSVDVTCTGTSQTSLTLAGGTQTTVLAYYNTGASGSGRLTLTASSPNASDNGYYTVQVVAPGVPQVALRNSNGDNHDRSLCLTSGAGEAAAWACGDLVVTHGLPGYATLGRERSLTLLYSSAQAVPQPEVVAAVNEGSVAAPATVFAKLLVNKGAGYVAVDSATYGGVRWGAGYSSPTRQIALAYGASGDSSGAYPFELIIRNQYSGGSYDDTLTGQVLVVNRSQSRFGAGWSLVGVEQLYFNQPVGASNGSILWVGGDGSAKLYSPAGTNKWAAPLGAYRDTIYYDPTAGTYTDTLGQKVAVTFDAGGRHVKTTNRLGHVTTFYWTTSGNRLDSIAVPPASQSATVYRLAYDGSNEVHTVTDPANRTLTATVTSGNLMSLTDPDGYATTFAYDAAARLTARTSRRGFTTKYVYGNGLRVTLDSVPLDTLQTKFAVTTFSPWDEQGLAPNGSTGNVAPDTGLAYTKIDGPRTDVADTAEFWVDRWGAPVKTVNPIGATTTIVRGNGALPALVTGVTYPDGRVVRMGWTARGHLDSLRDSVAGLPVALTRWTYTNASVPDSPDSVIDPAGVVARFAYDPVLGLTTDAIRPNGHVTHVDYKHGALQGLDSVVTERNVMVYDSVSQANGGGKVLRSPQWSFGYNALGNLTSETTPLGRVWRYTRNSAQLVDTIFDPLNRKTDVVHDALNRVIQQNQHVESVDSGYTGPLVTRWHYHIDVLDSLIDPRGVARLFGYDAARRQVLMKDDYGGSELRYFDPTGLVDSVRSRYAVATSGPAVRYTYDAAGRRTKQYWPAHNSVPADSILYTYDVMGRILTATDALGVIRTVTRTYFSNGAVKSEVGLHTSIYGYDVARRRAWYVVGTAGSLTYSDSIWYQYDAVTGDLRKVAVRWRGSSNPVDSVRFQWDSLGRRDTLISYPHGSGTITVGRAYDADGMFRQQCSKHAGSYTPDVLAQSIVYRWVDSVGDVRRIEKVGSSNCPMDTRLSDIQISLYDSRHEALILTAGSDSNVYRYDGSGNRTVWRDFIRGTTSVTHDERYVTDSTQGAHNRMRMHWDVRYPADSTVYRYDANGARIHEIPWCSGCDSTNAGRYYAYDGLGRTHSDSEVVQGFWVTSQCYYDQRGRSLGPCSGTYLTGYDGDNVVRTAGDQSLGWTFVQGPGTDDPLMGRYDGYNPPLFLYWLTDGMGRQYAVADTTGYDYSGDVSYAQNGGLSAGGTTEGTTFAATRDANPDIVDLSLFRNRFYDQATGRWTQEDPIGVAGGLNLYGYVGNDPMARTDPYGTSIFTWLGAAVGFAGIVVGEVLSGGSLTAALLPALEATGATAAGSAAAAGVESLVTGEPFLKAFERDFSISEEFLGGSALLGATVGGGLVHVGANGLFQGYVESRTPILFTGGLTIGSGTVISGGETIEQLGGEGAVSLFLSHELGHTFQFIALSGFGNPWVPYLALGGLGMANEWGILPQPGGWWEEMASLLGAGGQCSACVLW